MISEAINISKIVKEIASDESQARYTVCWIKDEISALEIDQTLFKNVSNAIYFLNPIHKWKIHKKEQSSPSGYILYLSNTVLDNPLLSHLHINKVRLFSSGAIPLFKLSPGIEKRTQAILEMIDELLGSQLNHKDEAILSLLNTFFVYCDGQCNIKSVASNNNAKTHVVYSFKKLVDEHVCSCHEVSYYANLLHISSKYLNECVNEVLYVSAKHIIIEQLLMRSRHALKFSNKTIKEISFELGFSSPDYFSSFFKSHTEMTPSALRRG
ncbi:AraC family transcriptional regulator [Tamlana haliotis]|uniref:AraC family transcriptional regulator n=1 Tax=Pseudotamlana haliotis TaxID=2614804 RepID=A0A6N6MCN8_9FLAO|nr:helix-turn-helix domain-containing protein [Tamlana haliotis]KAB1067437.1 AraC family transcriptional regulator [Tamlana haliotis]